MSRYSKMIRVLAFVLALGLSLSLGSALAQSTPSPKYLQTELTLDINKAAMAEILGQMLLSDESGEAAALFDKESLDSLDVLLDAINKIWMRVISGPGLNTLTLDTEEDILFDIQLVDDQEGPLATVTTSLLPGAAIRVPQDVMKEFIGVLPTTDALATQPEWGQAYTDAIEAYFVSQVPGSQEAVPGAYEMEGAGSFTKRTSFTVDSHMILGMIQALLDVVKQDAAAQEMVTLLMTSSAAEEQPDEGAAPAPKDAQELIASLEQALSEAAREEPRELGTQTIYQTDDGLRTYVETLLNARSAAEPRLLITLLNEDGENGQDNLNQLIIITDNPDGETHSQQETDWDNLLQRITDGSNTEDSVISLTSQTAVFGPQQKKLHNAQIGLQDHNGTYALVSGTMTDLTDGSEEGSTSLFLLANEPLISVYYTQKPLGDGEVPALPSMEGRMQVYFGDGVDAQEEQRLGGILETRGLPNLIINIAQALPEEAERIIAMLMASQTSVE